ncbi:MAG: tatB [Devosia sp.]|nr:tatB [Devosia sp.]
MMGIGWTEMLVIGVFALIFIGPKELPNVMRQVGKFANTIRKMGSEFQREINKTTGLDEVRNLRNSITAPLKKTADEIRREFNTMTPTGTKPSGALKPADPKSESVVAEIQAAAGIIPAPATAAAAPVMMSTKAAAAPTQLQALPPKKPRVRAPSKAIPVPNGTVTREDLAPVASPAPAEAIAPAKPTPATKSTAPRKLAAKPLAKPAEAIVPIPPVKVTPTRRPRRVVDTTPAASDAESKS